MDVSRMKDMAFRHVEKIVLGAVILFVSYQVYLNLFGSDVVQLGRTGGAPVPAPEPSKALDASFWRTTSPFLCVPSIERARYNWFYPPYTHWGRRVELIEGKAGKDVDRRPVRRKVVGTPQVTALTEDERKYLSLPEADADLTEMCQITVTIEPAAEKEPPGHVLVIQAVKAGYWARVMVMLENRDRFCVPVRVLKPGTDYESRLAIGKIDEDIKEHSLGTVTIRFNAPQGSVKTGDKVMTYIEPTYFEIRRKGERDKEEVAIGRVPGRTAKAPEAGPGPAPLPTPRGPDTTGFPGAKSAPPPKKKGPAAPPKGAPPVDPGEMVFEDQEVEAEVRYEYRIRSVLIPREEGEAPEVRDSDPPVGYRTLARFSFAYLGGDGQHANIRVYIGPRDKPQGSRDFERIPIGGWVGEVPKEFRVAPAGAEETEPPAPKAAPAAAKGAQPPAGGAAEAGEGGSTRFVTRYILVDIEQNVFRPVPQVVKKYDGGGPLGKMKIREVMTYRETQDRRIILRDQKNRLHHLWKE